jgi:hypothetical protein
MKSSKLVSPDNSILLFVKVTDISQISIIVTNVSTKSIYGMYYYFKGLSCFHADETFFLIDFCH